ncbi:MAG: hypothetical protein WEB03_09715 [Nitriliruptor sp.]|uniref:hypothetical protein n=1 Tax=Nitriliruptor sp. TaxID=2448056 RepID=UPI0034A07A66
MATLLALLLLLAACTSERDPSQELADAVQATAAEPFSFGVSARADRAALDQLGGDALAAASFLEGAGIDGARDPDGRLRIAVTLGGDAPLLEVIAESGDAMLLRTGLGAVLGLEGRDPSDALEPALDRLGIDAVGREALVTSFSGGWVALTDIDELGELVGAATGEDAGSDVRAFGLADLLAAIEVTGARDAGEIRRLDIEVETAVLLERLGFDAGDAASDRTVPGTVDLRDGKVSEVRVELSGGDLTDPAGGPDADRDGGEDGEGDAQTGVVELVLTIDPVTEGDAVERPQPGAELTAAQLIDLVERLQPAAEAGDVPSP